MRPIMFLMVLALAGCAGSHYVRPGGTNEAFQRDAARCRMAMNGLAQYRSAPLPQSYTATTTASGGIATTTVGPTGSSAGGQALMNASDELYNVGAREQVYEDCLMAEGWTKAR